MHTYHLYFSLLLNRTEKNELAPKLAELSRAMLAASEKQYEQLKGTQWKDAALRNVAFFSVAASLQEPSSQLPDYAADMAAQECSAIYAASGIDISELTGDFLDYSQFKPRGYYEGDETLERYFRAMMWYGQINFTQKNDSLNRSALLMTLAMLDTDFDTWEKIYTVTSFFAGASDDLGYYEYEPAIEEAYGGIPGAYTLATDEKAYARFVELVGQMDPPAINSIPVWEGTEDIPELKKGFRFMGQRFTIDASVMQQLVYSAVDENSSGEKRLLPDTLDMPAALGSDAALDILTRQGETDYPGYSENMAQLRQSIRNAPEGLWSASLYASWLYTLNPLLEEKGAGYLYEKQRVAEKIARELRGQLYGAEARHRALFQAGHGGNGRRPAGKDRRPGLCGARDGGLPPVPGAGAADDGRSGGLWNALCGREGKSFASGGAGGEPADHLGEGASRRGSDGRGI